MIKFIKSFVTLCVLILFAGNLISGQEKQSSLSIKVPFVTAPFKVNGTLTTYYELHLTNNAEIPLVLKKLEVIDASNSEVVESFSENDLEKKFKLIGKSQTSGRLTLPPSATGIVYLEITSKKIKPGRRLNHRLKIETGQGKIAVVTGGKIELPGKSAVTLGPPLRDGFWAAIYNPAWERGHRRVFYTVEGKDRLPGRFAVDFIRLDDQGRYASQDENVIKNWLGYENEVIAVSDGVISSVADNFSESSTVSEHPKYPPEKATGNYVSIKIKNDCFAFYEHLKAGSLRVKPGQTVKKGDVIAKVGFTGQTSGPHLHFHLADNDSPLGAEGVPFAFEKFKLVGTYPDFEKFGKARWTPLENSSSSQVFNERPASNSVIEFKRLK